MRFLIIVISTCIGFVFGEDCKDKWKDCRRVALNGECAQYPTYAKQYCAYSCRICDPPECKDKWENCTLALQRGYCSHYSNYTEGCASTCGKCNPRITMGDNDCKDKWEDCRRVALSGECSQYPTYAKRYCAYSCRICDPPGNVFQL